MNGQKQTSVECVDAHAVCVTAYDIEARDELAVCGQDLHTVAIADYNIVVAIHRNSGWRRKPAAISGFADRSASPTILVEYLQLQDRLDQRLQTRPYLNAVVLPVGHNNAPRVVCNGNANWRYEADIRCEGADQCSISLQNQDAARKVVSQVDQAFSIACDASGCKAPFSHLHRAAPQPKCAQELAVQSTHHDSIVITNEHFAVGVQRHARCSCNSIRDRTE